MASLYQTSVPFAKRKHKAEKLKTKRSGLFPIVVTKLLTLTGDKEKITEQKYMMRGDLPLFNVLYLSWAGMPKTPWTVRYFFSHRRVNDDNRSTASVYHENHDLDKVLYITIVDDFDYVPPIRDGSFHYRPSEVKDILTDAVWMLKINVPFEERAMCAVRSMTEHPHYLPVIVCMWQGEKMYMHETDKFLVTSEVIYKDFSDFVLKSKIERLHPMRVYRVVVPEGVPQGDADFHTLYANHADPDGFLYMVLCPVT